jgi:hypothetical protein
MTKRNTCCILLSAPWLLLVACGGKPDDPRALALGAVSMALTDGDASAPPTSGFDVLAGSFGRSVVDAQLKHLADPSSASRQAISGSELPARPAIGDSQLPSGSSQSGQPGIGETPLSNLGLPAGPPNAVSDYAADVCEFAAQWCERVLACTGDAVVCRAYFSTGKCSRMLESLLLDAGVTAIPAAAMQRLNCISNTSLNTPLDCKDPAKALALTIKVCAP